MNLNQAITAMNDTFLSETTGFAEPVWHWPAGNKTDRVQRSAVVDWDAEEGQQNVRGDGRIVNGDSGRSIRQSVVLEMAANITILDDGRDKFELLDPMSGEWVLFGVKRIIGRDRGMQSVLCIRVTEYQTQNGRRIG